MGIFNRLLNGHKIFYFSWQLSINKNINVIKVFTSYPQRLADVFESTLNNDLPKIGSRLIPKMRKKNKK